MTRQKGTSGKGHTITYRTGESGEEKTWDCDAVAVCAGLHVLPNIPTIPGMEKVPIRLHSSQFKGRHQFGEGKTVMVLGAGETASDITYLAVTSPTKQVVQCHRYGFHLAPKVVFPAITTKCR